MRAADTGFVLGLGFWPHLLLRFGTGVASAWVLVMITALSQPLALAAGRPRLGALVFAGPGLGIMLTGLLALGSNLLGHDSADLWLLYAAAGLLMLLAVLPILPPPTTTPGSTRQDAVSNGQGLGAWGWSMACMGWATSSRRPSSRKWPAHGSRASGRPTCSGPASASPQHWAWPWSACAGTHRTALANG